MAATNNESASWKELQLDQVLKSLWGGRSHRSVKLQLSTAHFTATATQDTSPPLTLPWSAVLGAHILSVGGEHLTADALASHAESTFLLGIFACVSKSHKPQTLHKRRLSEFFFRFSQEQLQQVLQLQQLVNFIADPRNQHAVEQAATLDELELKDLPARKFLVLVNPVSGPGKAVQIYENKVAPVLKFANVETDVRVMERQNHAMEIVMEMPLGVYDCVVAVGGDGSLYEIVQGLMKRPDWNVAIRQPIGIIPGGSGNGLAYSIAHQSEEKGKAINSAFILAKGLPHDLDITSVRNGKETTYSFLSLEWASIADVDIESEKLRALGPLRFTITYLNQILFQKPEYPGKIWYLEEDEKHEPARYFEQHDSSSTERPAMDLFDGEGQGPSETTTETPTDEQTEKPTPGGKWKELSGHFRIVWIMNVSHAAADAHLAPGAEFDDGYNYITFMDGEHSRKDLLAMLLSMETGEHVEKKGVQQVRTRAFKIVPERPADLMCVDGEVVEGPFLEAQVHRGLARIMAVPRWENKQDKRIDSIEATECSN